MLVAHETLMKEQVSAKSIEDKYMKSEPTVLLNEKLNHYATPKKINAVAKMWREAKDVYDIAHHFKDDPDNIVLIIIHLANEGRIKQRSRGLLS
ncbi:hypothetical protein ACTHQ4_10305 [Alkalicoccobacillus gibsonii]|uniref:hypothetical protein n=1 Tax=Alkalicoccobacillus gibsonii TaxID=79881 RepID=UPI003F7B61FE